jgi:hypothetical protein
MENFADKFRTKYETGSMGCDFTEESIEGLEKKGWEYVYFFNYMSPDEREKAGQVIKKIKLDGGWETVLVGGQDEEEIKNNIQRIYKRKIERGK